MKKKNPLNLGDCTTMLLLSNMQVVQLLYWITI